MSPREKAPTQGTRERAIDRLEKDVEELRHFAPSPDGDAELERIRQQVAELRREFYAHIGPWQRAQIARHPQRPYTLDFIGLLFTDFFEMHGDRGYGDDKAIVAGLAKFHGRPVAVVGHQKGRDTKQRLVRNFGQPKPEGYRKALRVMKLAAKYGRPIFTFIDTQGAYPGLDAEERGQAEAIALNLREMARLPVPIIVTVTGEGGSGGALAIAVGDRVNICAEKRIGLQLGFVTGEHPALVVELDVVDGEPFGGPQLAVERVHRHPVCAHVATAVGVQPVWAVQRRRNDDRFAGLDGDRRDRLGHRR